MKETDIHEVEVNMGDILLTRDRETMVLLLSSVECSKWQQMFRTVQNSLFRTTKKAAILEWKDLCM